jgi:DNA-directed RNA polymerase subunit K/omega
MKIKSSITQFNLEQIASKTGNIYKSVKIIGKRAKQLSAVQKEELNEKLAEFASDIDNLEEIFENKEQIEISRYFERLPKSSTIATEELINDELFFRNPEDKDDSISNG